MPSDTRSRATSIASTTASRFRAWAWRSNGRACSWSQGPACSRWRPVRAGAARWPRGVAPPKWSGFLDGLLQTCPSRPPRDLPAIASSRAVDRRRSVFGAIRCSAGDRWTRRPLDHGGPLDRLDPCTPLHPPASQPSFARSPSLAPLGTGVRPSMACSRAARAASWGLRRQRRGQSHAARHDGPGTAADISVIALVGERGREVRSFLEHDLGPEGLARSVVVGVHLRPPAPRATASSVRGHGHCRVLPGPGQERAADDGLGDPLRPWRSARWGWPRANRPRPRGTRRRCSRCCRACSERAGNVRGRGSITAFYTVLVEGDDHTEPIADHVRAILDGHIVLSRELPHAITTRRSTSCTAVSRTMPDVATVQHRLKPGRSGVAGDDSRHRGPGQRRRIRAGQQSGVWTRHSGSATRSRRTCGSRPRS